MFEKIRHNVVKAVEALKAGKPVIVLDDYDRENEGDIIFSGEKITAENIAFMLTRTSGIICLAMNSKQAKKLNLTPMVAVDKNNSTFGTPFTISIEAKEGVTTGVSAKDRAHTIQLASKIDAKAEDLVSPGHIFPLVAHDKGVIGRGGHTEATVDLMKLSGFNSAGVLCELMNKDGTMMKTSQLAEFAKEFGLPLLTIEELYQYRLATEIFVTREVSSTIPLKEFDELDMAVYKDKYTKEEVVVLSKQYQGNNPLIRMHSSCITGDLFGSLKCDCQSQLHYALKKVSEDGGFLIYLEQEGRGIGLINKLKAYNLQLDKSLDTIDANLALGLPVDSRKYDLAVQVLKFNNIKKCRLLSNNPKKKEALERVGIEVQFAESQPCVNEHNKNYLKTKADRLQHRIKGF